MSELFSLGIRLDRKMVKELNQIADEEHVRVCKNYFLLQFNF